MEVAHKLQFITHALSGSKLVVHLVRRATARTSEGLVCMQSVFSSRVISVFINKLIRAKRWLTIHIIVKG